MTTGDGSCHGWRSPEVKFGDEDDLAQAIRSKDSVNRRYGKPVPLSFSASSADPESLMIACEAIRKASAQIAKSPWLVKEPDFILEVWHLDQLVRAHSSALDEPILELMDDLASSVLAERMYTL